MYDPHFCVVFGKHKSITKAYIKSIRRSSSTLFKDTKNIFSALFITFCCYNLNFS